MYTTEVVWDTMSFETVFQPDGKRGKFMKDTTVLEAARSLGVDINTICGGAGACGKCIIKVMSGETEQPTEAEKKHITAEKLVERYRLACLVKIKDDLVVLVPGDSRTGTQRLQTEGLETPVELDPVYGGSGLGFAVDVGSTKLAGYLIDLLSGSVLAVSNAMNPQIPYGEDIISRIAYAIQDNEHNETLHTYLIDGIRKLIEESCIKSDRSPDQIVETVLVGNTAMQHFILGKDPYPLSRAPFMPEDRSARSLPPETLRLAKNSRVYIPPLIAGFVGADCVAATLATGIHRSDELCFMMDIGTNTEIVVGNRDRLVSCSCASGPAFEGAHIRHGMRAATGAIEGVWIDSETLEPRIKTIDDGVPIGICGSGLIDLLSEMFRTGIIDSSGRFSRIEHPRNRETETGYEYVVTWGDDGERDIVLTQRDVRELQKGKAAIYSGAYVSMKELGVEPYMIKHVYIAGAFGTYIDRRSAATIGMIPEFNQESIQQVGNAAGTGARMILLSREARAEAEGIPEHTEYIELATNQIYNKEYIDALMFPHRDLSRFPETVKSLEESSWVKGRLHKT